MGKSKIEAQRKRDESLGMLAKHVKSVRECKIQAQGKEINPYEIINRHKTQYDIILTILLL